jgi:carbon storage regulator
MLVLSRKAGQSIQIGENITITVTRIGGNQVRLGIEAPMETPVRRSEIAANKPASDRLNSVPATAPAPTVVLDTMRPLSAWLARN